VCIGKASNLRDISIRQRDRRAYDVTIVRFVHSVNSDVRAFKARAEFVGTGPFSEFDAVIILRAYRAPLEERVSASGHEAYLDDGANGLPDACQFPISLGGSLPDYHRK